VREGGPAHLNGRSSVVGLAKGLGRTAGSSTSSGTWPCSARPAAFTLSPEIARPVGARTTQAPQVPAPAAPSSRPTWRPLPPTPQEASDRYRREVRSKVASV